jgi:hypothetical protein
LFCALFHRPCSASSILFASHQETNRVSEARCFQQEDPNLLNIKQRPQRLKFSGANKTLAKNGIRFVDQLVSQSCQYTHVVGQPPGFSMPSRLLPVLLRVCSHPRVPRPRCPRRPRRAARPGRRRRRRLMKPKRQKPVWCLIKQYLHLKDQLFDLHRPPWATPPPPAGPGWALGAMAGGGGRALGHGLNPARRRAAALDRGRAGQAGRAACACVCARARACVRARVACCVACVAPACCVCQRVVSLATPSAGVGLLRGVWPA